MMIFSELYFAIILPNFEYYISIWISAADCHLKLLDRAFSRIKFILPDVNLSLKRRRVVGCLVLFFKILHNPNHPLYIKLPGPYIQRRTTRYALSLNDRAFSRTYCRTEQFSRSFLIYICKILQIYNHLRLKLIFITYVTADLKF